MRDAGSKKDARFEFRLSSELNERVEARPDITRADAGRLGFEIAASGEEFASVKRMNERDFELLAGVESEYRAIEAELSNALPDLADRLREARLSVAHEVTRDCYERVQWAESEAGARATDPEAASPGYEKSPVEAVESLLNPDGTLAHRMRTEGAENPAVETQAEKCGMTPDEFWGLVQEVLSGEAFESRLRSGAVATDGGGSA